MCGSGTILIEAALMAGAVAPGLVRADASHAARRNALAFENWPDHDRDALDLVLREAGELGREARKALGKKPVPGRVRDPPGRAQPRATRGAARRRGGARRPDGGGLPRLRAPGRHRGGAREEAEDDEAEDGDERSPLDTLGPVALRRGGGGVPRRQQPAGGRRVGGGVRPAGTSITETGGTMTRGSSTVTARKTAAIGNGRPRRTTRRPWRTRGARSGAFFRREWGRDRALSAGTPWADAAS